MRQTLGNARHWVSSPPARRRARRSPPWSLWPGSIPLQVAYFAYESNPDGRNVQPVSWPDDLSRGLGEAGGVVPPGSSGWFRAGRHSRRYFDHLDRSWPLVSRPRCGSSYRTAAGQGQTEGTSLTAAGMRSRSDKPESRGMVVAMAGTLNGAYLPIHRIAAISCYIVR